MVVVIMIGYYLVFIIVAAIIIGLFALVIGMVWEVVVSRIKLLFK